MNVVQPGSSPTQRLWLQVHARHAEQPWLLPSSLIAMLIFVLLLASYVSLVHAQVLRGERLREAQRNAVHPASWPSAQPLLVSHPLARDAAQSVPQNMMVATSAPMVNRQRLPRY